MYHPRRLKVRQTDLPGVLILEPRVHTDPRGWFMETFTASWMRDNGLPEIFLQDNHSLSTRGVVRGLHYQLANPQGKIVRCVRGSVFDVAVDIRRSSPTFGRWTGAELSEENRTLLWIPPGFAHGFSVLSDTAEVIYKCTTQWDAKSDRSIAWNDPDLAIDWRVAEPIVSAKDGAAPSFRSAEVFES